MDLIDSSFYKEKKIKHLVNNKIVFTGFGYIIDIKYYINEKYNFCEIINYIKLLLSELKNWKIIFDKNKKTQIFIVNRNYLRNTNRIIYDLRNFGVDNEIIYQSNKNKFIKLTSLFYDIVDKKTLSESIYIQKIFNKKLNKIYYKNYNPTFLNFMISY